jgi:hypothetical protein
MRHTRVLGLALVAVLTSAVVSASAASAHEFSSSAAGKLRVVTNTTQIFKTDSTANTEVKCRLDEILKGTAKLGNQKTLEAEIGYTGCETFVAGVSLGVAVVTPNPEYIFSAEEKANLQNTTTTIEAAGCTIVIKGPQNNLKTIKYKNELSGVTKVVNFEANVSGISFSESGIACGTHSGATATYTGDSLVEVVGGNISWS